MTGRAGAIVVGAIVLALAGVLAWFIYGAPGDVFEGSEMSEIEHLSTEGDTTLITVEEGQSAEDIGGALEAAGAIRSGNLFEVLVGLSGLGGSLEAGDYEFEPNTPAMEAVHRIADGRTASRQVIFPEGQRAEEMGELLEANNITTKDAFMAALVEGGYNEPFLADIGPGPLDGFLFPAGYEFKRNTSAGDVVAALLHGFQVNVADEIQLEGQPLTWREVVALAAIVQREAVVEEERPMIAGVFLNRLRAGMPLQADPTVQFAITVDPASVEQYGWWKEELTVDDLAFDSPYNTYIYSGLTPGPIANPGAASIAAVIRPAQTEALFFVAKGDGSGEHVFANTLEEHLINVEQYRQRTGQ
jgi:UPF0755 protein